MRPGYRGDAMDASEARALLKVPPGSGRADLERAFRRQIRTAHPDRGGNAAVFHALVQARDVLRRSTNRRPSPVIIVADRPWWHPLTRVWPRPNKPSTRRVI